MEISSENVKYSENYIDTVYEYQTTVVEKSNGKLVVSSRNRFFVCRLSPSWNFPRIDELENSKLKSIRTESMMIKESWIITPEIFCVSLLQLLDCDSTSSEWNFSLELQLATTYKLSIFHSEIFKITFYLVSFPRFSYVTMSLTYSYLRFLTANYDHTEILREPTQSSTFWKHTAAMNHYNFSQRQLDWHNFESSDFELTFSSLPEEFVVSSYFYRGFIRNMTRRD